MHFCIMKFGDQVAVACLIALPIVVSSLFDGWMTSKYAV